MQLRTELAIWLVASHIVFGCWVVLYFNTHNFLRLLYCGTGVVHLCVLAWIIRIGTPKLKDQISTYVLNLLLTHRDAVVHSCTLDYEGGGFAVVTEEQRVVYYFIHDDVVEVREIPRVNPM